MIEKLLDLQEKIYRYVNDDWPYELGESPRVSFSKIGDFYEINFFGEGYDDDSSIKACELGEGYNYGFCAFLDFIIENPNQIVSLRFMGPDLGANGTDEWNFSRLIHSDVVFENLQNFYVTTTEQGHHNFSIICGDDAYDEGGVIAALVSRMPKLTSLTLPSAPNKEFFELEDLQLLSMRIQAGYDHQNFIANLATSENLTKLGCLDYTDVFDLVNGDCTSFDDYKRLFESDFFSHYEHFHFTLRDPRLTPEQLQQLAAIKKIQLLHIDPSMGDYIRPD